MTKYQKAQYIREMLAEEATDHGLNMQVVLSNLSENEMAAVEKFAQRCRSSHSSRPEPQTVTFVVDWEQDFA